MKQTQALLIFTALLSFTRPSNVYQQILRQIQGKPSFISVTTQPGNKEHRVSRIEKNSTIFRPRTSESKNSFFNFSLTLSLKGAGVFLFENKASRGLPLGLEDVSGRLGSDLVLFYTDDQDEERQVELTSTDQVRVQIGCFFCEYDEENGPLFNTDAKYHTALESVIFKVESKGVGFLLGGATLESYNIGPVKDNVPRDNAMSFMQVYEISPDQAKLMDLYDGVQTETETESGRTQGVTSPSVDGTKRTSERKLKSSLMSLKNRIFGMIEREIGQLSKSDEMGQLLDGAGFLENKKKRLV